MDDAPCVRGVQAVNDLQREAEGFVHGHLRSKTMPRRLSLEQRHHDERAALVLADVMNRADVRAVEGRSGPRLALKPRPRAGLRRNVTRESLHRHRTVQPRVLRAINHTHTPRPSSATMR